MKTTLMITEHKAFIFLGAFFITSDHPLEFSKTSIPRNARRRAYSLTLVCRMRSTKVGNRYSWYNSEQREKPLPSRCHAEIRFVHIKPRRVRLIRGQRCERQ